MRPTTAASTSQCSGRRLPKVRSIFLTRSGKHEAVRRYNRCSRPGGGPRPFRAAGAGVPGGAGAVTPPANRWALLIGVDQHQGGTRSNFGGKGDVADMKEALVRNGFPADHIRVLTDAGAKAADIRAGLAVAGGQQQPEHLLGVPLLGPRPAAGHHRVPVAHDNAHIPDTELAASLQALQGRAWINIAGCEAAGFDEGVSGPTRLFTAASQSNEKGYELPAARASVFTCTWCAGDAHRRGRLQPRRAGVGAGGLPSGRRAGADLHRRPGPGAAAPLHRRRRRHGAVPRRPVPACPWPRPPDRRARSAS